MYWRKFNHVIPLLGTWALIFLQLVPQGQTCPLAQFILPWVNHQDLGVLKQLPGVEGRKAAASSKACPSFESTHLFWEAIFGSGTTLPVQNVKDGIFLQK